VTEQPAHKIDWVRTIAGALAAVVSAVLLSRLGAAGTIIGAALGSVVISITTSMFSSGLAHGRQRVADMQEAAMRHVGVAQAEINRATRRAGARQAHLEHADEALAQAKDELATAAPPTLRERLAAVAWLRVAAYAGGLFVAVVAVITGFELLTGEPVSTLTGGSSGGGTSISRFTGNQHPTHPRPVVRVPSTTPSPTVAPPPAVTTPSAPATVQSPSASPTQTTPPTPEATPTETATPESPSSSATP
jgi:hypothetical protein